MWVLRSTRFWNIIVALAACLMLASCGDPAGGDGASAVFLSIEAQEDAYTVACDVYNPAVVGNVADDTIKVTVRSIYKNQADPASTLYADVIIQEYRIEYFRSDGNLNVPEPFTYMASLLVPNGGELDLEILVVRATAKLLSPLKELAFGGGEGQILMNAVVQFFGEDLSGNSVSGQLVVPIIAKDW